MTQAEQKEIKRRKRDVAVGAVVRGLMETEARKKGVVVAQVLAMWPKICPLLATWSYPDELRGGTLKLVAASDAVKQELLYMAPQLLLAVNALLGFEGARKVSVVTRHFTKAELRKVAAPKVASPAALAKAKARCKDVRDDNLRAALEKLGALILDEEKAK